MNHVGITHVGVNGGYIPRTLTYKCCAKMIEPLPKFSLSAVLVYYREFYLPNQGNVYSPASKVFMTLQGVAVYLKRHGFSSTGTPRWSAGKKMLATGYKAPISHRRGLIVKAIKKQTKKYTYCIESKIKIPVQKVHLVKGFSVLSKNEFFVAKGIVNIKKLCRYIVKAERPGVVHEYLKITGLKSIKKRFFYGVSGEWATQSRTALKISGAISRMMKSIVKVYGKITSNVFKKFYRLEGFIPKIAFISAVPKKFQDFKSDKRWFR